MQARIAAALLLALAAAGCSSQEKAPEASSAPPVSAPVMTVALTSAPSYGEAVGTVRAAQSSELSSQTMGTLMEVRVREGERVRRGDVLAVIDDAGPRAARMRAEGAVAAAEQQIAGADAELALTASTLRRYEELFARKSVSPQEFDEVKARHAGAVTRSGGARAAVAQARAELRAADTLLGQTRIRAPFAGIVTVRAFDAGALAAPGTPLFTIEDDSAYRVDATVDAADVRLLRTGARLPVAIDSLPQEIEGRVAQITPAADAASRSFLIKIAIPRSEGLRSGIFARVRIPRGEREALLIPKQAVVVRGQLRGVYLLDAAQKAQMGFITLGAERAGQVEVLSGLLPGQRIVSDAGGQDLAGRKVEVR